MSQIKLSYTIIPIFSRFIGQINKPQSYPPIDISLDWSLIELFDYIKNKDKTNGTSLLPIGLLENKQIIDFTENDRLRSIFYEIPSPMIYLFRKNDENPNTGNYRQIHPKVSFSQRLSGQIRIHTANQEENDLPQLNDALKTLCHPESFTNTLFIHLHNVTNNNISQIIALPNDNDRIALETIHNAVKNVLKEESIDKLIYLLNGYEITNEELLERNKYSFITVINRPDIRERSAPMINLQIYEMSIRISIYSVLFTRINLINLERFLNYCDQNKSFTFEIRELEISLLTIIELLNEQIGDKWTHMNYYNLLIPQSTNVNLTYFNWILLFGDTLLEYIRTTQLPLLISQSDNENKIQEKLQQFMPRFLECLDKTLSISLVINPKQTEIQTATILCQNTFIYLLKIVFSSILFPVTIIIQCCMNYPGKKGMNKKLVINLMFYFCSIILILPIFNIIIYYSRHIRSFEANQMEIYWPLVLIISILIILHVYQTSSFHRKTFLNKNILENTYNKAHLNILEIKSTPNNTETSKYLIENEQKIHFYQILERKSNEFHPTLLRKSITDSLTNSSQNNSNHSQSSIFYYIIFIFLTIAFISLITIHPLIPTIYRIINSNMSLTRISSHIKLIHYSYITLSFIFYSLLIVLMIKSISAYLGILYDLQLLLSSTDLKKQIDFESTFYLNLRREENLEYFLHLFQRIIGNIDENHILITTMTCSLLIDIILILTAIIRVFVYGRSTDLLTVWCLIDIIILSFFIMLFIIIVVLINKSINYDFIRHLRNLKKDIVTSNIVHKQEQINCDYLDVIIEHIESVTDQYSVKLLGFVVDHSLAIKIFLSIITGIASAIASLVQQ